MTRATRLGLAITAGLLSAAAIPPGPAPALAWIALTPLLFALPGASATTTIMLGVAYAVTLGVGNVGPWMAPAVARYFSLADGRALGLTVVGLTAIGAFHGVLLGILLVLAAPGAGPRGAVRLGAAWVLWEAARTLIVPYFPTAILATSQVDTSLLGLARFTGIGGITCLVAACNAVLTRLWTDPERSRGARWRSMSAALLAVAVAAVVARHDGTTSEPAGHSPVVLGVDIGATTPGEATLARHLDQTRLEGDPHPQLVLWPESAVERDLEQDREAFRTLRSFVDTHGVAVLTGGPGSARVGAGFERFNSVHLLSPGTGLTSYHKRRLMPLAEDWPRWLGHPPAGVDYVRPGSALTLFSLADGSRFGVLVCFEIADAGAMRDLVRRGADFLVNPTNDTWFAGTAALPHEVWARVRAVELGLPIVRVANAGPSGIIDAAGRWVVVDHPTPRTFRGRIPPRASTPYAAVGDVLTVLSVTLLIADRISRTRRAR